jgi:hypothetical protein
MRNQFQKHYTRDEARGLLPEIREWLGRLRAVLAGAAKLERKIETLLAAGDAGGELVNQWVRSLAETKDVLWEFHQREIQIKDVDRGLIDFPAIVSGKEVFLCWEEGEEDVDFWHDLDAGYAGRERLE